MVANRLLLLAATCLVPVGLALTAEAQTRGPRAPAAASPAASGVVRGIDVTGNQRIEADTIRSYMLLQPGDPFDADRLDRSLRTLFATGLFRDVTVARAGDRIQVAVQENPIVNRVAFEGNSKVSDDVLTPEVTLRARAVFTPQAAQADRQRILDLYARRGRFAARVEPKVIELDQNRVDVVFEITEGDAALVSRVSFVGNTAFSDSRLKDVVATREQAWYRILSTSDIYDPERLNFDRELLRRYYLRQGYADVQVTGAVAELAPDRSGFFVTYTIDEGPRYRVGRAEITSTLRGVEPETLRGELAISEGDWYDGDAVERSVEALSDAVGLRGVPFVEVRPRVVRDRENRRVDVTFEVAEGTRAYVERIDITGNSRTADRVIRREFRIAEGDAFNAAQVRRSRQRIRDLGYFGNAEINVQPGSAPDRTVLVTSVTERPTGEISLGGGFSTDAGFLTDFGIRERNFLGTGVDTRLQTLLAQRRTQVDFSITDPSFLDRNLAAGLDVFYITRDLQDTSSYSEKRVGFALRAGYEFNERVRQSWSYSLVQRDIFDVQTDASRYIREQSGITLLSQVGTTLSYDVRDSRIEPRSGYIARVGTDVAGLGGDVAYIRWRGDVAGYIPLERYLGAPEYVLALQAGVGLLTPWGDRPERIIDRFFLGGDNLRGFALAGAGPRDTSSAGNDDPLGGRLIWTQTTELRFPLPLPSEIGLLGRAFVDVGSLSRTPVSGVGVQDDSSPRVGAGVGVSWRTPVGLINIDIAQAVVKKSYDETQLVRFGFGTRF
ncbi:outer membrane protein assembly factor BamA [Falsiroseomonas tokyonensis]|uniref:Outer membrane protein assembly factor BamA n=1 Tax=Falsiroseomonas tokyonensis TaxID=430521 RepID=A0ABV7BR49_9PROT|nr:outer membrane protein assembly factor BamA [Falsiroseomonas tokyonensis]MBU8538120.1 outer membrane protein assembly factor BamA [Falsiroseomonas tokyonensis]